MLSTSAKTKAVFFSRSTNDATLHRVYENSRRARLENLADFCPFVVTKENFDEHAAALGEVEAIFSTWGMFAPTASQLDRMPKLRAVFYAAGSVRYFAEPFLERGITVVSAWAANAIPVAEMTLAQILLANKGYARNVREFHNPEIASKAFRGRGNFGATVSLLGAGQIGRKVIELLAPFRLSILVFDPFLDEDEARRLGVKKVDLAEAFARGNIVSNHLANVPATIGMLRGEHFATMPENSTFINTARGATVNHDELLRVMQQRSDLTALLDVTEPEPLPRESPFWTLPNVLLSSHIGGSIGDEVVRMADYAIEEFEAWREGRALRYAVTPEMLPNMA